MQKACSWKQMKTCTAILPSGSHATAASRVTLDKHLASLSLNSHLSILLQRLHCKTLCPALSTQKAEIKGNRYWNDKHLSLRSQPCQVESHKQGQPRQEQSVRESEAWNREP